MKSHDFPGNPANCPRPPRAAELRALRGFLWIGRNSAKTDPTWRGAAQYATSRIRWRSGRIRWRPHRIFRKSRGRPANLRNCFCPMRGGYASFTGISRGLSEFGESDAYLGRAGEVPPPDPRPIETRGEKRGAQKVRGRNKREQKKYGDKKSAGTKKCGDKKSGPSNVIQGKGREGRERNPPKKSRS